MHQAFKQALTMHLQVASRSACSASRQMTSTPLWRGPRCLHLDTTELSRVARKPLLRTYATSAVRHDDRAGQLGRNAAACGAASNKDDSSHFVPSQESNQQNKRKGSRSVVGQMSLRRVAVEAQRSAHRTSDQEHGVREPLTRQNVTAYAVAEQFNITKVAEILLAKGYEPDPLKTGLYPKVVHIQVPVESLHQITGSVPSESPEKEVGDVFIFPSGTIVSWSLPDLFTSYLANKILAPAAVNAHEASVAETENLDYVENPEAEHSTVKGDTIILGTRDHEAPRKMMTDVVLTKIAFSSGLARSTRLAVLESLLQNYFDSTRNIPLLLSKGTRLPFSRRFILRKTGQLLSVRAHLNLYSELTDSLPDIFWDSRHELGLEGYYDQVGKALDVGIRIKILNERMDYAQEIATVLREILNETHGVRLEWIIILLIAVEVAFEIIRLTKEHQEEQRVVGRDESG